MKMFATLLLCTSISLAAITHAAAAELVPIRNDQQIGISLSGVTFPNTFARDLKSGLENRVLIQVTVARARSVIARKDIVFTIKYDLWEETFKMRRVLDDKVEETVYQESTALIAFLSNLRVTGLFSVAVLTDVQEVTLRADILMNPIEREKMEQLRQWVAENSVPSGAATVASGATPLTTKPNDLFNKIFEQYISGADIVAPWRLTVVSKPFTPRQLSATQ